MKANNIELTKTSETLFGMLSIYKDEYDAKYVYLSYENEYYIDSETFSSLDSISENEYDAIVDSASIGTLYYVAYNI